MQFVDSVIRAAVHNPLFALGRMTEYRGPLGLPSVAPAYDH
jgi:hypothetical protein